MLDSSSTPFEDDSQDSDYNPESSDVSTEQKYPSSKQTNSSNIHTYLPKHDEFNDHTGDDVFLDSDKFKDFMAQRGKKKQSRY